MGDIFDGIAALKDIGTGILQLKDIPTAERARHFEVLSKTFELLDNALLLVMNRLGDILNHAAEGRKNDVIVDLKSLDNFEDWERLNRGVRLCSNLRVASREMESLWQRLVGRITLRDPHGVEILTRGILEGEGRLADVIGAALQQLAATADAAQQSQNGYDAALTAVRNARNEFKAERQKLIETELQFHEHI